MVTESYEDGEGELLSRIRQIAPTTPIAIPLDMHANVSDAIAEGNIIPWTFNEEWPAGIITTYLVQNAEEYFSSDMTTDEFLKALNDSFVTAANE